MDKTVILTIAQAILANTKVLQTLVESLPKEVQAEVAKQVTAPAAPAPVVAAPAPTPVPNVQPVSTPVAPVTVAPVAPAPVVTATVSPSDAPFADHAALMTFVMDSYKALGPIKGAKIQDVLTSVGVKNINEVKPEMYAAIKAGVEALKG